MKVRGEKRMEASCVQSLDKSDAGGFLSTIVPYAIEETAGNDYNLPNSIHL